MLIGNEEAKTLQMEPLRDVQSSPSDEILATPEGFVPTGFAEPENPISDWQISLKRAIRSESELRRRLGLAKLDVSTPISEFPTFVPLEYLAKIRFGDPHDPLLLQVLPTPSEAEVVPGFVADPVGDLDALVAGGALHKYHGRVLLTTTGACGVHCRYCFRREFPYQSAGASPSQWQPAIEYLQSHTEVDEVILSGGDPLTIVNSSLFRLFKQLESIPHLQRLRIHSRMPIVIPSRLCDALIERLATSRLACYLVVHANHPRELCDQVLSRLKSAIDRGIVVMNQAVLLRGVNDSIETLVELCQTLINHRIHPYYLHQLDRVRGAAHFEVPIDKGRDLVAQLRLRLPGYAIPTYVAEYAKEPSKSLL